MSDDLEDRVLQFHCLKLPGQVPIVHMGTSYLVSDLWGEVRRLRAELETSREQSPIAWGRDFHKPHPRCVSNLCYRSAAELMNAFRPLYLAPMPLPRLLE